MEDAHITQIGVGGKDIGIFGVFDGHAGKTVALYAASFLL
jgi:serine/threonine protein phosphatase PrpC